MNTEVMFGKASDEWRTPLAVYAVLDAEFSFDLDVAATATSSLAKQYYGPDHPRLDRRDALTVSWGRSACFMNPPYSQCRAFMTKAAQASACGATVVCLVPARTDTRWWHGVVWDADQHRPRPGVEVRFLKGRVTFGGTGTTPNAAPFPSAVIVFRPVAEIAWELRGGAA